MAYDSFPILIARAPNATPTTFTTIAELDTVSLPELGVNEADTSIQNATIDRYVVSSLLRRKTVPLMINFLSGDATHDHVTGLIKAMTSQSFDGYKFSHAASSLLWIASGFVTNFKLKTPKEGPLGADITMRFSNVMTIQGVVIGS